MLLAIHIWRVRKDGFAVADRDEGTATVFEPEPKAKEEVPVDA